MHQDFEVIFKFRFLNFQYLSALWLQHLIDVCFEFCEFHFTKFVRKLLIEIRDVFQNHLLVWLISFLLFSKVFKFFNNYAIDRLEVILNLNFFLRLVFEIDIKLVGLVVLWLVKINDFSHGDTPLLLFLNTLLDSV